MPNIAFRSITEAPGWPESLDDLRQAPGRIVFLEDLARLGIAMTYDTARRLPPPLRLPTRRKAWEARTILAWIGADGRG